MSLKPCFILPNWKHKTVPFCWRSWVWTLFICTVCVCIHKQHVSVQVFFFLQPYLEGYQIIAIISQSSSPSLAPQPQSHRSQIVWGYRFRYLFTTSPHTVSCKNSSWNRSMDICCCSPALVLTESREQLVFPVCNPLTKWMDCFGNRFKVSLQHWNYFNE